MKANFNLEAVDELSWTDKGYEKQSEQKISLFALDPEQECNKVCVFGTCLEHLMQMTPSMSVPYVVSRLCKFIERYGLSQRCLFQEVKEKSVVECLKMKFNESGDAPLEASSDVLAASVLLKLFFEELPEPLIPKSLQDDLFDNMRKFVVSSNDCVKNLRCLVDKLPYFAFCLLKYLSHFLFQIACHGESNGLSCVNLGTIFGPIIFRPLEEDPLVFVLIKNITCSFVADYYSIFEEHCDVLFYRKLPKILLLSPCRKNKKIKGKTSSLDTCTAIEVTPMQPLSVMIPSVDVLTPECDNLPLTPSGPVLLIEKCNPMILEGTQKNFPVLQDELIVAKHSPVTRKRKEHILTEDSLSFYGTKDLPSLFDALETKDHIDENKQVTTNATPLNLYYSSECLPHYGTEKDESVDYSSHPPDAKRRELDSIGSPLFVPKCELNINNKLNTSLEPWLSFRKSLDFPYKDVKFEKGGRTFDLHLKNNKKKDTEDYHDPKPLFCVDDTVTDKINTNASLHRSSSCPLSTSEGESNFESESTSLALSWNTLFHSEEPVQPAHHLSWPATKASEEEPVPSYRPNYQNEAPLSPSAYKSYLSHRCSHLDSSVPPSPPFEQEHFEKSSTEDSVALAIKQLTKKIHALKKKIWRFEEKYELEYGYKPSHAEKTKFPEAKKMMSDLHKLRKSLKILKESHMMADSCTTSSSWLPAQDVHILEDATNCLNVIGKCPDSNLKPSIQTSYDETLKSLNHERKLVNRPESVEDMTVDQVKDEKLAIQKSLLQFESIHGKPSKPSDRNTVRPLYDRYRNVKRLLCRSSSFPASSSKTNGLQPIMEHEAMDFSKMQENKLNLVSEELALVEPGDIFNETEDFCSEKKDGPQLLEKKYNNSYLHELPLHEMVLEQQQARVEKRRLHKILREFEAEFLRINGRKVQKEEKAPVEALYTEYKLVKARLRLLEALVSKHHEHISSL